MNDDSDDVREVWRLHRVERQQRHAFNKASNLKLIQASSFIFNSTSDRETLLFREPGKPRVDFYPSTGRWKVMHSNLKPIWMKGGASAFLAWYEKQSLG